MKTYCIDIDGVLCDRDPKYEYLNKEKYNYCFPIQKNINFVNNLYNNGNRIILFTSRGMSVYNGDVSKIYLELFNFTTNQMREFGVQYHKLIMGKPHYDYIIDDKAINVNDIEFND